MRARGKTRGSTIIEFALSASLLVALFGGVIEFGYTFYVYENLVSAVRAGARYGALSVYDPSGPTLASAPSSPLTTAVTNVTVYGNPAGAASGRRPVVTGLRPEHVCVDVSFWNGVPHLVTVSIRDFSVPRAFGSWTANKKPLATFLYMGRYDPPAN